MQGERANVALMALSMLVANVLHTQPAEAAKALAMFRDDVERILGQMAVFDATGVPPDAPMTLQ
jgi:hypothetical protein